MLYVIIHLNFFNIQSIIYLIKKTDIWKIKLFQEYGV